MSKLAHRFIAVAPAAQHCAELTERGPAPDELSTRWQALGERLAGCLPARLGPVLGKVSLPVAAVVQSREPRGLFSAVLLARNGANGLLQLAIDGAGVLRLVDRAFGGRGEVPDPLPGHLPPSAELMVERIEAAVCAALAEALGCAEDDLSPAIAFGTDSTTQVRLTLAVTEPCQPDWHLWLTLPDTALGDWLGAAVRRRRAGTARSANPAAAPFADVPLQLAARLVDMRLPLSTIAALEPGMVVPVAVARAVPLEAGGVVIARGTVGNQDDRIAIKLTQIA